MYHLIYIDPGSGSFIVQALISAVLTVTVFFKQIRDFVLYRIFRKKPGHPNEDKE